MDPVDAADISAIYDAASDPLLWPDVLRLVADRVGAASCTIMDLVDAPAGPRLVVKAISRGADATAVQSYLDDMRDHEIADQAILYQRASGVETITLFQEDIFEGSPETRATRPHVQRLRSMGIAHCASALLSPKTPAQSRFTVHLAPDRGRLTPQECAYLNAVLPHLAKAMELGRMTRHLSASHEHLLMAMDRLRIGVCVLDHQARMVQMNEEFRRQYSAYDVFIPVGNGKLAFEKSDDERMFHALLDSVLGQSPSGARSRKEAVALSDRDVLCIEVASLQSTAAAGGQSFEGAVLYSTDTSVPLDCDLRPMAQVFGLSEAEMAIMALIADGKTNADIARQRNRAVSTINSQVKAILSKTRCTSRTQLVRLMMTYGGRLIS